MSILTGINAGIVKSQSGDVLAIVLKTSSEAGTEHLLYLQPDQFQELMFATCNCYKLLQKAHQGDPERIKDSVVADTEKLSQNIPVVTLNEVQNPIIDLRVMNFVMKHRKNKLVFMFFLQNNDVLSLTLTLTQMEYVLNVLVTTIHNTEDTQFISASMELNDFIPFYTIDFINEGNKGIKYNQFDVTDWKSDTFEHFYSVIFIQNDGNITCGAIIKAGPELEPERVASLGQLLLQKNSLLLPYQNEISQVDYMMLDVPGSENDMGTLLRASIKHRDMKLN